MIQGCHGNSISNHCRQVASHLIQDYCPLHKSLRCRLSILVASRLSFTQTEEQGRPGNKARLKETSSVEINALLHMHKLGDVVKSRDNSQRSGK